jgi:subtilisin family serine protease
MPAARPRATVNASTTSSRKVRTVGTFGAVTVTLALAGALLVVPGGAAQAAPAAAPRSAAPGQTVQSVTLVTGDVVRVVTRADGRRSVTIDPGPSGVVPQASISEVGTHLYVVPQSAIAMLAAHRLDLALFDVNGLIKQGYDDAHRASLPLIIDYGVGAVAAARAAVAAPAGARRTRSLSLLGDTAFDADKKHARQFWKSVTAASSGAVRIDLDARVHLLDVAQPLQQIHAPQAWAAGYDGTGVKVAVLDTGYDPTHPDLAGKVALSANFSTDATIVDGNGHGTHVAGTIAGSGVQSGGTYKGVAPGATLLIGKVLGSDGSGADSQVLAGMQWAVAQHADIVSMSLGGDTGDGTDLLEQAVDQLSASSTTLFVIAAGNNGSSPSTITSPGAADAALTVGAVDSTDTMADFSSRGPRAGDGALKPDVVAPGVNIVNDRAAGTSLGDPVNDWYTSLSGTSMATPHVAGIAAIVKQEHPTWTGQQLKEVIAASTVPVANATAFDAGSGRADALAAVNQTVVTDASHNLGFFKWPHATLAPQTTQLTYANFGSTPATLAVSLAGEDGSAAPVGVTLGATTVTVPAGGTANIPITVDPTVGQPGAYSGVVTATVAGSAQTVRTSVGYVLEDERYNLTVVVKPRTGTQSSAHVVTISGLTDYSFDTRQSDASPAVQTFTFRVPPESYAVGVTSFGLGADNATESVMDFNPSTNVSRDRTVVLDESRTKLFDYRVDKPAVTEAAVLSTNWASPKGAYVGLRIFSTADRLYAAQISGDKGGVADAELNYQLSQPEGEVLAAPGDVVGLRPLTAPDTSVWWTAVPRLPAAAVFVNAGSTTALRLGRVKNAVALVSSACADLTATSAALAEAGALALVAYPAHGSTCAGTVTGTPALPGFSARPLGAKALLAEAGRRLPATTHASPQYAYDLATNWPHRVPAGATLNGTGSKIAALVESVRSQATAPTPTLGAYELLTGWLPNLGSAVFGLSRRVPFPSTVTHYVSAAARWDKEVVIADQSNAAYADFNSIGTTHTGGSATQDTWFGGPVGAFASNAAYDAYGWLAMPNRQGDNMTMLVNTLTDSAGHNGAILYLDEFAAKVYQNGKLIVDAFDPLMLNGFPVPSKIAHYKLDVLDTRANAFWQLATSIHNVWGFSSGTPAADHAVLPLMNVQYKLPLSAYGTAKAGVAQQFAVTFSMPAEVAAKPLISEKVQVSWDEGKTWGPNAVVRCTPMPADSAGGHPTRCAVAVAGHAPGKATLRVTATDTAGNSVTQTVVDAYAVE